MTLAELRRHARLATLFGPTTLAAAVARLGFVQADPLRAPARAQDLVLRHRVRGYRAGDLERGFGRLGLEEDFLHAYGFMPREVARLLHPRADPRNAAAHPQAGLATEVLDFVRAHGPTHPRDLEARFGRGRTTNGWGGLSVATTHALEALRHGGLLRVASRRAGVRVYEAVPAPPPDVPAPERARVLVMLVAGLLAPASRPGLRGALALMARRNPGLGALAPVLAAALADGALQRARVDGEDYLWPAAQDGLGREPAPRDVRLLAPFDPVVWDRRRFEHLWGWAYRSEAYTPASRRRFGHYALPLLWGDDVIGWGTVVLRGGAVDVRLGHERAEPRGRDYRRALDAEVARLERFLVTRDPAAGA